MTPRSRFRSGVALWVRAGDEHAVSTGDSASPVPSTESPRLLDARGQLLHQVVHIPVLADHARDLRGRVDYGGVVAAAELLADLRERRVGELAGEIHRDLSRIDDVLRALVAAQLAQREPEALRDELLDPLDRDLLHLALVKDVLEHIL